MKRSNAGIYPPEKTKGTEHAFPERFLLRDGLPVRSLLPDERPDDDETVITLIPGISVEGVAGAGGAAIDGTRKLGGWCSFRCELAVPRRFAAREGKRLAAGGSAAEVLRGKICDALQRLFDQAAAQADSADLRTSLSRRLREEAGQELLRMGWRLTGCRLENIQITRSEDA